ncbi:Glycolipid transfer protein domain-containing protein 1 [Mizuhopecten yessoensis]|uniref:Glycolipid transfer protein domain-containing protein 1 n=1 Tax=Mizuhopecten yessoensis TaxID=6573 RepID=A0A210PTK6_MIZYE|nr:Glycolipid transfer protein domain-containing protein 1 [Mizuhopecten yessoensis]
MKRLFGLLGSIFGFVVSDVVEKIGILRDYRKSPDGEHYISVQSMIKYEVQQNITDNKKKESGSRTLLRLHRAMEFTAQLMKDVRNAEDGGKMSSITRTAYDATLSKHHPWLIRKGVHVAMYTLPSRKQLLEKIMMANDQSKVEDLMEAAKLQQQMYDVIQDIYKTEKLLNLP